MNTIEGRTRTTLLKMWNGQPLTQVETNTLIDDVELLIQKNNKLKSIEHGRETFEVFEAGFMSAMYTVNCFIELNSNSNLEIDCSPRYIQDRYKEWVSK